MCLWLVEAGEKASTELNGPDAMRAMAMPAAEGVNGTIVVELGNGSAARSGEVESG